MLILLENYLKIIRNFIRIYQIYQDCKNLCWNGLNFSSFVRVRTTNLLNKNGRLLSKSMHDPTLCWNEHQFFEHQTISSTNFPSEHDRSSSSSMLNPTLAKIRWHDLLSRKNLNILRVIIYEWHPFNLNFPIFTQLWF